MRIVQLSLNSTPEDMLKAALDYCIRASGAGGGSILGEEGPHLVFLFSNVESLIGMPVPFNSIAGLTVEKNVAVYTYTPADPRHFDGVDNRIKQVTRFLLSVPIPAINNAGTQTRIRNAGALQLLFNNDILPAADVVHGAKEFSLAEVKSSAFYDTSLKDVFAILPLLAFGVEVMRLRQTSYQTIHELKNKMIAGASWLNNLREDIEQTSPGLFDNQLLKDDFELSAGAIREGAELAKNYLQFTKLYQPDFRDTLIAELLEELAGSARAFANSIGLTGFTATVQPVEPGLTRTLDPDQFKMALFNLAKNAIEAMATYRSSPAQLTVSAKRNEDRIEIAVADSGPGMPQEIADNLFIPFKTKKEGGTGLGLAIAKKIVDIHSGSVRCETGGTGTTFRIVV